MKNNLSIMSRLAVIAMASGGLCLAHVASGQTTDVTPEPGRVGSMAGVGAKPSKAEQARMDAEKAGKTADKAAKTRESADESGR